MLKPSIQISDVITSKVDIGSLNVSISASGKVVPLYEEVITSPVSSKILTVYKKVGDSLSVGDPIMELDLVAFNAEIERQQDELDLKKYKMEQQKIITASTIADMDMQVRIDEMRLKRMEVLLRNETYLDSIGASTGDKIRQTQLDYQVQTLQFEQLKLKCNNQKLIAQADIRALELDYKIALKNASLLRKKMGEAQLKASRTAILTMVNDQVGSTVAAGAQLGVISDLSNFKIEGEISDSYANKISVGDRAEVKIGSKKLSGTVGNVTPSISNGMIKFIVLLDESNNDRLRAGLNVDIHVINAVKVDVMRIDNHSFYAGAGEYDMWIINGKQIEKRTIQLGESSFDKVEVVSGVKKGDHVIVSNMKKYQNLEVLKLQE
ncbi:MAG: efflux RND transporter periplasmic adaptor subunit [Marinifilaceae bacterium]